MQQFNIQESSLFYTAGVGVEVQWLQSPAGIQHFAPFPSELSAFVLHCSTLSGTSTLKCQSSAEENWPSVFKLLCFLSAERYLSEAVLSPHIISSGITALGIGEAVPLISPFQTTAIHLLFTLRAPPPPTVTSVCQARSVCGGEDYQRTKELEAS